MARYENVILIDDDEITNYINENIIQDLGLGKQVKTYVAAEKALSDIENIVEHPPTLVLLDLKMPVFDGFDFLEEYRKLDPAIRENIKVVVLSTSENPNDLQKVKELGYNDYIIKPLTKENLRKFC